MVNERFCGILVYAYLLHIHHMTEAVQAVVVPVEVSTLSCCALVHSVCDLKLTQCNILTLDRAVNQEMHLCNSETGASGRRYRNITLTCGRG